MIKIFQYNNQLGCVELATPEIILISEFNELMKDERNICKEDLTGKLHLRAFREFTYIFLAIDWKSPYADYVEQERHTLSLGDAKLSEEEFNNPEFRAACRKYKAMLDETCSIKLLKAAKNTVNKFVNYFNNIDPEERDELTGKPIFKVKDIMAEVSSLSKVQQELTTLEGMAKKELAEESSIRGGAITGYEPDF